MEIKSVVVVEVKKDDFVFSFHMPVGSKFGDAYEACWECLSKVTALMKDSVDKTKPEDIEARSE